MIPDAMLRNLCDSYPPGHALATTAAACLDGDAVAWDALHDLLIEEGMDMRCPLEVGQSYLICQVTLYYVGRVVDAGFGWVWLEDASWVHWTGRLSLLLKNCDFEHRSLESRRPRTEYCGRVLVWLHAGVSAYPWVGKLPKAPVE